MLLASLKSEQSIGSVPNSDNVRCQHPTRSALWSLQALQETATITTAIILQPSSPILDL